MIIKLTELMGKENNVELFESILKKSNNRTFRDNIVKVVWENNAKIFANYVMIEILANTVSYQINDSSHTFSCGEIVSSKEEFQSAFENFIYEFAIDRSLIDNKLEAIDYLVNDTISYMLQTNELSQITLENGYIEEFYPDLQIDTETLIIEN